MRMFFDIPPHEFTSTYNAFWEAWTESKPSKEIPAQISSFFRGAAIGSLQTITATTLVYAGIPLLLRYIAKIAENNLSRPKLITEARYTNWYDQLVNAKSSNIIELFIKTIGYGSCLSLGAHAILKNDFLQASTYTKNLQCSLENQWNHHFSQNVALCDGKSALTPQAQVVTAIAIGTLFAIYQASWILPSLEFSKDTAEGKPIFHSKLSSVLEKITKTTNNLKEKKGFLQNVLLYGPGGTGKTMIAKFIARSSDMNYVMISGGDLAQYIMLGTHVSELNKLFIKINNASTPTILFIDEAESLCCNRSQLTDKPERLELLNAFLNHTGENSKKIMLMLATNRPEDIDPAILSRMDHKLQIYPPALAERKQILQLHISRLFTPQETTLFDIEKIAQNTEGLTGRALFKMLNAIFANKSITENEKLTKDLITSTVKHFIEQEKFIAQLNRPTQPKILDETSTKASSTWNNFFRKNPKKTTIPSISLPRTA
ncbi:MAG: AAA family ATPase [Rhabdochlamydiaceae bacterium]|nr:AAA family ATPase [Rhabdochlamydiaceae bacterium]